MKILVAVEPAVVRRGIVGLARLCQQALHEDPFAGTVFVFRNRKGTALEGADVRRPGILAVPQAALPGPLPLVAVRSGRRRPAVSRAPAVGVARGWQPDAHGGGPRLASRRPTGLTSLPPARRFFRLGPCRIAGISFPGAETGPAPGGAAHPRH